MTMRFHISPNPVPGAKTRQSDELATIQPERSEGHTTDISLGE
jgi:hypothetical protein